MTDRRLTDGRLTDGRAPVPADPPPVPSRESPVPSPRRRYPLGWDKAQICLKTVGVEQPAT